MKIPKLLRELLFSKDPQQLKKTVKLLMLEFNALPSLRKMILFHILFSAEESFTLNQKR